MRKILCISILLIAFFSCKKDKLEDENQILIGKWSWVYSSHGYGWCDGDSFSETLNPETEGHSLSMEFYEKGIVKYYENNKTIGRDRIIFHELSGGVCDYLDNSFHFDITLNNDKDVSSAVSGCVNSDSIILTYGFPYEKFELGCESYTSYFIRE